MAPVVTKSLSRLSRDSLVDLCLKWTQSENSTPYLTSNRNLLESDEEDYLHEPAENIVALRELYNGLKDQGTEKDAFSKRDIIDRIIDGDWRRGLSLQQLADIDFTNLEQNDTALRWSALKLVPFKSFSKESAAVHPAKRRKISPPAAQVHYPTISPANFMANLKSHISPLVKAHYTVHRLADPSKLVVLRLYIVPNIPFAPLSSNVPRNVKQATDSARVMYIALPDSCPYVYVSLSGSTASTLVSKSKKDGAAAKAKIDMAATKRVILESIPKALSKPQERWSLENTKLTCRSLKAIGLLRGNSRPGTAGGCYSKFSEEYKWKPKSEAPKADSQSSGRNGTTTQAEPTPVSIQQSITSGNDRTTHESEVSTRFGNMTNPSHAKLDRFHITINNLIANPVTSKADLNSSTQTQPQPTRKSKRKRRSLEDIEAGRDEPIQAEIHEIETSKMEPAPISITFSGTDVFRGLKELALIDGGKYVDLSRLPSWATGEKGVSGLVI